MGHNLFKNLKQLKSIEPDAGFALSVRENILGTAKKPYYRVLFQKQFRETLILSAAMTMAIALLFVISSVSRLPLKGLSPGLITSLDNKDLTNEEQDLGFNLQLARAKYYKESTTQVTMAINAVGNENSVLDAKGIKQQADNLDSLIKELVL